MNTDQIFLFAIFGGVFVLLIWGRWRYDIVAFGALMTGVVVGAVEVENAFSGFGHEATLVVALVLIVSAGLVRSGAVYLITRTMVDSSRSPGAADAGGYPDGAQGGAGAGAVAHAAQLCDDPRGYGDADRHAA